MSRPRRALLGPVGLVDHHDDVRRVVEEPGVLEPEDRRDDDTACVLPSSRRSSSLVSATFTRGIPADVNSRAVCSIRSRRSRTTRIVGARGRLAGAASRRRRPSAASCRSPGDARSDPVADRVSHPGDDRLDCLDLRVAGDDLHRRSRRRGLQRRESVKSRRMSRTISGVRSSSALRRARARPGRRRSPQWSGHHGSHHSAGSDGAVAELLALGREREHVGHEEARVLPRRHRGCPGAVQPGRALADRRLRLPDHERKAVDPQHDVVAAFLVTGLKPTSVETTRCWRGSSKSISEPEGLRRADELVRLQAAKPVHHALRWSDRVRRR